MNVDVQRNHQISLSTHPEEPPDVRLMHAGQQLGQFKGEKLVWEIEEIVTKKKNLLIDPVRHAAREVDPYAESVRKIEGDFVPKGVSPVK